MSLTPIILLLFLIFHGVNGQVCRAGLGDATPCNDVLIIMDFSFYMKNNSFILQQYDFVREKLLPAYNLRAGRYGIAIGAFGFLDYAKLGIEAPLLMFFTRFDPTHICDDIDQIKTDFIGNLTLGTLPLARVLDLVVYYADKDGNRYSTVILFTASIDQGEIDQAGEYYRDVMGRTGESYHIVIVSINNPKMNYAAWYGVANIYRTTNFVDFNGTEVGECIATTGCSVNCHLDVTTVSVANYTDRYYTAGTTPAPLPTHPMPTTTPGRNITITAPLTTTTTTATTTTTTTIKTTPIITTTTTSGAPPYNAGKYGCECDVSKIWLDIMVIIDSSSAMTLSGIQSLNIFLLSTFLQMNIGQDVSQVSRIGLVVYGGSAELVYKLTEFTSRDDLLNRWNPKFLNENSTNLESAIKMAHDEFERAGSSRPNTKQVMIVAASTYSPGQADDPLQIANQTKQDGIKIITIEYVQNHGLPVPILYQIASPNYNLSNIFENLHTSQLQFLLCQANCFCTTNWDPAKASMYNTPDGGCYYPVLIPALFELAQRFCHGQGGIISAIEDQDKALFISKENKKMETWIGLQCTNQNCLWDDGSALGAYQPWATNNPNTAAGTCVWQNNPSGLRIQWQSDNCTDDHMYICQRTPCSSVNFCTDRIR